MPTALNPRARAQLRGCDHVSNSACCTHFVYLPRPGDRSTVVAAIALPHTVFLAVIAGVLLPSLEILSMMNTTPITPEMDIIFAQDIRTGVMFTLGICVVLASGSTAIQQAIRAVDSTEQHHALIDMRRQPPSGSALDVKRLPPLRLYSSVVR